MADMRRLAKPVPAEVKVRTNRGNIDHPATVDGNRVEEIREEWLVEDRWWDAEEIRRHYFEVLLPKGRVLVVFRDLVGDGWFRQQA